MFNFKNRNEPMQKWDPNNPSTQRNKLPPGLSKYWRYTTLDAQNSENNFNNNNQNHYSINNNGPINNSYNYSNQGSSTSPDEITLEISYDNFYTLGVDMMKKKKYAEELKKQIEEKKMRKKLENQKKKLDDLNDDIRIEKERKMIEDRQKEDNKRFLPRINITPYYPKPKPIQEPMKIYTPPPPPPMPLIDQYRTPPKPKLNLDLIKSYSGPNYIEPPKTKIVYRKVSNTEETKHFLREREEDLEKFNRDMRDQLTMLKNDFNYGMKQLNDEVDSLNNGIGNKNHNFRYLITQKVNELSADIKNNNNKKLNIQTEHIYNVIRKSKDGKTTVQQFMNSPQWGNLSNNIEQFVIKTPSSFNSENVNIISDNNIFDEFINNSTKLPYINLSHCIS